MKTSQEIKVKKKIKQESILELKTRTFLKEKRLALGYSRAKLARQLFGNDNRVNYIYEKEEGRTGSIGLDTLDKWLKVLKSEIVFIEND
jgi:transcriptional regulator with XRE-family HTH domain